MSEGKELYGWASDLFPICRSITGAGVRETLSYIGRLLPGLNSIEVPSGTEAFDWTVPEEWNIRDAFIADSSGNRVVDFHENNLHVVGYSEPVDIKMSFAELDKHLHSLPHIPDAVPYVTSYYSKRWGFCLSHDLRERMGKKPEEKYHVKIDSTLAPGIMNIGELIIKGETDREVLLSTYICHPSMANNELSGIVVTAALARWLSAQNNLRYTYRILFLPETIGAITYLSRHWRDMKDRTIAGFVVTCVGDEGEYSYIESRNAGTLADKIALHVLKHRTPAFKNYTFLDRGSDERQYCSPGIDLPVCSICRSKYNEYREYHTSLDNMDFISPAGLEGSLDVYKDCLLILEENRTYTLATLCEPQLGKRGLYPTLSERGGTDHVRPMMNFLAYADGSNDLIDIAERIGIYAGDLTSIATKLNNAGLVKVAAG